MKRKEAIIRYLGHIGEDVEQKPQKFPIFPEDLQTLDSVGGLI